MVTWICNNVYESTAAEFQKSSTIESFKWNFLEVNVPRIEFCIDLNFFDHFRGSMKSSWFAWVFLYVFFIIFVKILHNDSAFLISSPDFIVFSFGPAPLWLEVEVPPPATALLPPSWPCPNSPCAPLGPSRLALPPLIFFLSTSTCVCAANFKACSKIIQDSGFKNILNSLNLFYIWHNKIQKRKIVV